MKIYLVIYENKEGRIDNTTIECDSMERMINSIEDLIDNFRAFINIIEVAD